MGGLEYLGEIFFFFVFFSKARWSEGVLLFLSGIREAPCRRFCRPMGNGDDRGRVGFPNPLATIFDFV